MSENVLREFTRTSKSVMGEPTASYVDRHAMAEEITTLRSQLAAAREERDVYMTIGLQRLDYIDTAERERDEARRERDALKNEREGRELMLHEYMGHTHGWKARAEELEHRAERAGCVVEAARRLVRATTRVTAAHMLGQPSQSEAAKLRREIEQCVAGVEEAVRALDAAEGTQGAE